MQLLLTAYVDYAVDTLSMSAAAGRLWAVNYVWAMGEIRNRFSKLELELYAAGLS
jgi:hypothetical protein